MEALLAQGGVPRGDDDPSLKVFCFPNGGPGPDQEARCFSEWLLPQDKAEAVALLGPLARAEPMPGGVPGVEDPSAHLEELLEMLYDGHRAMLELLLRREGKRPLGDFHPIPESARWAVEQVEGRLMPVLRDPGTGLVLALMPSSARDHRTLSVPDPDRPRTSGAGWAGIPGVSVWYEYCGEGGLFVLGLDGEVLLMYVDGPGDVVYGRFRCSRDRWAALWLEAFGALTVEAPAQEAARAGAPAGAPAAS